MRVAIVILCAELVTVMLHQTVFYNKIKMEYYYYFLCGELFSFMPHQTAGELFSVMQHQNVSYNKIKMDYYFCGELFSVTPCPTLS